MCWKTDHLPVRQIAEKDIQTQKLLIRLKDGTLVSPFFDMTWEAGTIYEQHIKLLHNKVITMAFHSCMQIIRCIGFDDVEYYHSATNTHFKEMCTANTHHVIYNAIIPQGAIFYLNEHGEYASNKLVITEPAKIQ